MLVLTRKSGQSIRIGETVTITVVQVSRNRVRIGVTAPGEVTVHRGEIYERIQQEISLEADVAAGMTRACP